MPKIPFVYECQNQMILVVFTLLQYLEMYKRSIEDPAGFWSEMAFEFYWKEKWGQQVYSENLDITKGNINIEVITDSFIRQISSFESVWDFE